MAKSLKTQYKLAQKELSLKKSQDLELLTINEMMDVDIKQLYETKVPADLNRNKFGVKTPLF